MPVQSTILDRINIPSPCTADWDSMIGNDRVRFCLHCSKQVSNLSEMTRKKALELVARSKGQICVRYYRRPDGLLQTAGPQRQLYQIKRRASRLAAGAFTAALSLCSGVAAQTREPAEQSAARRLDQSSRYDNASPAAVDGANATLDGTVSDPRGAVIPEAKVTLINQGSGQEQTTTTYYDGRYYFKSLPAGTYTLRVEVPGFRRHETAGLVVVAGGAEHLNVSPEIELIVMGGAMVIRAAAPLVTAASDGDLPKVKELLNTGIDVNLRDKNTDSTALDEAVMNGNREMVRALLEAGAEINARNSRGQRALMVLDDDATEALVQDLVNAGAKVNLKDEEGDTALIHAAEWSEPEVLRALLNAGARVNAKNKAGETALMKAAEEGKLESVRLLIALGADINAKNNEGKTALKLAGDNDHTDIVGLLHAHSAVE
jgi:hypothetical protein